MIEKVKPSQMIAMGLSMVLDSHHKSSEFDQKQLMDDSSIKPN